MNHIFQIARNTFREAVRDRVLYILIFFALLMVLVSRAIGWISVGMQEQVVKDFSLAVISLFGALIAVFVGTSLIYKEMEKRTIYTILSRPVERWQFVAGKFFGLAAVLAAVVTGMGLLIIGYLKLGLNAEINGIFLLAIFFIFLELMVITSLAILFSTVASPILSAIFTFSAYLVGQVTESLMDIIRFQPVEHKVADLTGEHLTDFLSATHWLLAPLAGFFYYLLPNLSYFQLRNRVVNGPPLQSGEFYYSLLYAGCYCLAVLVLASALFQRRKL